MWLLIQLAHSHGLLITLATRVAKIAALTVTKVSRQPHAQCMQLRFFADFCDLLCPQQCCDQATRLAMASALNVSCAAEHQFDSSNSSTYAKARDNWVAIYKNNTAYGFSGRDVVTLGELNDDASSNSPITLPKALFGAANEVRGSLFEHDPTIDDVLGLGRGGGEYAGPASLLEQAYHAHLVEWSYTIYTTPDGRGGTLALGTRNIDTCNDFYYYAGTDKRGTFGVSVSQLGDYEELRDDWHVSRFLS